MLYVVKCAFKITLWTQYASLLRQSGKEMKHCDETETYQPSFAQIWGGLNAFNSL